MIRTQTIRQNRTRQLDLERIRAVAKNPELVESQVFDFGKFVIGHSGRNHNNTEMTPEGQRSAVDGWIGKAILFKDHIMEAKNQIGRVYDAWIKEEDGETVTMGRGYGIITEDHKDLFARIKNHIHEELSCGYNLVRSVCSLCDEQLDLATFACPKGHARATDGFYAKDVEFTPHHVSFTGDPAMSGAGLVGSSTRGSEQREHKVGKPLNTNQQDRLQVLAADGELLREWSQKEFQTWYKRNRPNTPDEEIQSLADRLSAREMLQFARVEEGRFREVIGPGKQVSETRTEDQSSDSVEFHDVKDIYKDRSK